MLKKLVAERLAAEFGPPSRTTSKVDAWDVAVEIGVVLQTDQPNKEDAAFVWLPYAEDLASVPEIALEYPGEAGRHSNTYASPGLGRGQPALKCIVRSVEELDQLIGFVRAMRDGVSIPEVRIRRSASREFDC